MAGETPITVVGNLTADPELRFSPSGAAVANFTVASTPRTFDRQSNEWKDGETLFLRCTAWRDMAQNIADSLHKGERVIVNGRLKSRSYETKEGENRTVIELDVDEVGPSLRYASAALTRNPARSPGSSGPAATDSRATERSTENATPHGWGGGSSSRTDFAARRPSGSSWGAPPVATDEPPF